MFNRTNQRFKNTLTSGATADEARDESGTFDPILGDGEGVHHICSSSNGIERERNDRTTSMEPGGDFDSYVVVTDRRVLGVLGGDVVEPEFAFDAETIARSKGRDGLLSSTLEVATADQTIRIVPDDGTDVESVATTIDGVATAWQDLYDTLASVEAAIDEYEERVANGGDPDQALSTVRSRLSQAHHCATKNDYTPDEEMLAEVEPIEEQVDRLRVDTRIDVVETLLDDAESALDDEFAVSIETALTAGEELDEARSIHGEIGSTAISTRLTDLTVRLDSLCESILLDARECCSAASDADDPSTALSRWEDATERYRAILDAGWEEQAGVDADAIRYQLAWVVGNRIDALREMGDDLEAEGDDANDVDAFEAALDCRQKARSIEAECPFGEPTRDADALTRLDDKIARSEWQWGEA